MVVRQIVRPCEASDFQLLGLIFSILGESETTQADDTYDRPVSEPFASMQNEIHKRRYIHSG